MCTLRSIGRPAEVPPPKGPNPPRKLHRLPFRDGVASYTKEQQALPLAQAKSLLLIGPVGIEIVRHLLVGERVGGTLSDICAPVYAGNHLHASPPPLDAPVPPVRAKTGQGQPRSAVGLQVRLEVPLIG